MIREEIKKWLKANNILELTNVQKKSLKPVMDGKNVLITAPTGYGKTLAVIIPLFEKILKSDYKGLKILYVAPTKSLNRDIFKRVFEFAEHLGLTISIRHGDTTSYSRAKQVKNPPNILITTPESLQSMMLSKRMRKNLESLEHVVVDEIHELVSSKRGVQLMLGLERLNRFANFSRIGISATISEMNEVGKFLCGDRACELISVSEPKESQVEIVKYKKDDESRLLGKKLSISSKLAFVINNIRNDLEKAERIIIFVNTRQQAEILSFSMKRAFPDLKIGLHHSSLSRNQRIKMEDELRDGRLKALISTSSMELGIDVGSIDLVIQFMSPRQVNKLVQRVGRSGHAYYKKSRGKIYTLNDDDYLESKAIIELMKEEFLEKPSIPFNAMDVLAHQIIGFLKDEPGISSKELLDSINKSYCFNLSEKEFNDFLKFLEELRYVHLKDGKILPANKSFYYYFENVSTIPDIKNYKIVNVETNSKIGTLNESFVVQYCNPGATIIMRGEPWDVLEIKDDTVNVGRARSFSGAVPSWTGELIPVSMEIAVRVGELRHAYYNDESRMIDSTHFFVEQFENNLIFHSCYGSKVNNTIGSVLSSMLSSELGTNVGMRTDPYRVIITLPRMITLEYFRKFMENIKPEMINDIIKLSAKNSTMFHVRFFNVGQRFGIIKKKAEYIGRQISKIIKIYAGTPIFTETLSELIREKMDVDLLKKLLANLEIKYSKTNQVTSAGFAGVNYAGFSGVFRNEESYDEIYNIVKERLNNKQFSFKCTNCGTNLGTFRVQTIPYEKCPKCGAKTIGFAPINQKPAKEWWDETSNLFLAYGKKACFVLAGYGVGIRSGKLILRKPGECNELIKDIIEQEKKFVRTRRFWN